MTSNLLSFIGLFYIAVPLLLMAVLAFQPKKSKVLWFLTTLAFGLVIAFLWASSRWDIVSVYIRPAIPVLFVLAAIIGYKRIQGKRKPTGKVAMYLNIFLLLALIVFFAGLNFFTFRGFLSPTETIDLASPFRSGKQIVLHGGASPFTNGHFHVSPQNTALDIVGLNALGMRAKSLGGGAILEDYAIYGLPVYSPVEGKVIIAVDQFEDLRPPKTDVENLAGNHLVIESDGYEIVLAHLKKGSVKVKVGQLVTTNTLIASVGNTGNTSEPHLHIHVEKGGEPNQILNGISVPFTIENRYLVRGNQIVH